MGIASVLVLLLSVAALLVAGTVIDMHADMGVN